MTTYHQSKKYVFYGSCSQFSHYILCDTVLLLGRLGMWHATGGPRQQVQGQNSGMQWREPRGGDRWRTGRKGRRERLKEIERRQGDRENPVNLGTKLNSPLYQNEGKRRNLLYPINIYIYSIFGKVTTKGSFKHNLMNFLVSIQRWL